MTAKATYRFLLFLLTGAVVSANASPIFAQPERGGPPPEGRERRRDMAGRRQGEPSDEAKALGRILFSRSRTDYNGLREIVLRPPAEEGGSPAAMSAPLTFGIAANAENADCAAFFFNWVASNDEARQINVNIGGSNPGGPADATMPAVTEGSVTNESLAAGIVVGEAGTAMDFIANATSAIFAQGWTPELQKMVGGRQDAAGLLEAVQAEYLRELDE